ncbi:MAG: hypothetical protein R3B06_18775 [Kofleriaceae bacterium]
MAHGPSVEEDVVRDLASVLARFQGDSRQAFGIDAKADAAVVRAAFMQLCKRYHPAKYARYSAPTVRLANEAFLAIRRAHDLLQRDLAPTVTPPGGRIATPPAGVPTVPLAVRPQASPPTGVPTVPMPGRGRLATPPTGVPTVPMPGRVQPPTTGVPSTATTLRQPVPGAAASGPAPARGPSLRPQLEPIAATDQTFERALDHLRAKRWAEARPLLSELAQRAPADPRYRAYLHYLRGWEAFELGKDGEARSEWRRALACDPGLGMAQWALSKTGLG